jgi:DNA ligase D-like protein (predicted 3'-phosphoesterase)
MTRDGVPFDEMCEPGLRERLAADPLSQYKRKRKFDKTPEPEGKEDGENKHRFVIQRHKAKRAGEHFDLRLENDEGAMSSWSIPKHKLPSGKEKLLAVKTEDHPLEYRAFEGTIPEGEYGAGEMSVHDSGTYEPAAWSESKIVFRLKGKKEKGAYKLFRTDGKRWMIMAAKDEDIKKEAMEKAATLTQRHNDKTDREEWALVSRHDPSKILKWFGTEKPSHEEVLKEERRVQWFKHHADDFPLSGRG